MSGSTQPVTQSWRAAEPRYPPHAMSYPVQIARPHAATPADSELHQQGGKGKTDSSWDMRSLFSLKGTALEPPRRDVALLEYQHHSRDFASHLPPGSIMQPQRRRPSLLSEFQPGNERSQELHLRTEAHSYLSDLTKPSDLEFIESKRPRLDLLQDPLMRHSPLLNQSQQGGTEDLSKLMFLWLKRLGHDRKSLVEMETASEN